MACFWHAHGCALSKLPATSQDLWKHKLEGNAARDQEALAALQVAGWRVLVIWECVLRGAARAKEDALVAAAHHIQTGTQPFRALQGKQRGASQR